MNIKQHKNVESERTHKYASGSLLSNRTTMKFGNEKNQKEITILLVVLGPIVPLLYPLLSIVLRLNHLLLTIKTKTAVDKTLFGIYMQCLLI